MCPDNAENTLDYVEISTIKAFPMYQTIQWNNKYFKKLSVKYRTPKSSWSPSEILNKNLEMCYVKGNVIFYLNAELKET